MDPQGAALQRTQWVGWWAGWQLWLPVCLEDPTAGCAEAEPALTAGVASLP